MYQVKSSPYFRTLIRKRRSPGSPSMWGSPTSQNIKWSFIELHFLVYFSLYFMKKDLIRPLLHYLLNCHLSLFVYCKHNDRLTFTDERILHLVPHTLFNLYLQCSFFIHKPENINDDINKCCHPSSQHICVTFVR